MVDGDLDEGGLFEVLVVLAGVVKVVVVKGIGSGSGVYIGINYGATLVMRA